MKDVAKTMVLFQRGMMKGKRGEMKEREREEREMKEWRQGLLARAEAKVILHGITNPFIADCLAHFLPALPGHLFLPRMIPVRYQSSNIPSVHPRPCHRGRSNDNPNSDSLRPHPRLHDLNNLYTYQKLPVVLINHTFCDKL